ncbi:MAG: ABC transporter permease [Bacteroidota bacterium]
MINVFKAFVRKEVYHILRDRRTLFILFGVPIAQVMIFGYAITNEFRDASIHVLDHAGDQASMKLVQHLQSSGNIQVEGLIRSESLIEDGFKSGITKLVLVIPEDFSEQLYRGSDMNIQLLADGSDPNNASTLVQYITAMINDFRREEAGFTAGAYQIGVETRMLYNPQLISAYNFIPGTIAFILLMISAMMTSLTIAREKELGTMEILLVSPLNPFLIILGKVTPYALLSFINAILVVVIGYFVFDVPVLGGMTLLLSTCLLYVVTALALGTLISTVSTTQQDAMMRSLMGLMMPSMLLSGFIFPIASMPEVLQIISRVVPATYFIRILKGVMLRGTGFGFVAFEISILALMTALFLFGSYRNFKIRLE